MNSSTPPPDHREAKDRLLDAAEELFAAKGFDNVSVRELAAAAEVNVAAVNYHFQSKEKLFEVAISRRFSVQRDRTLRGLQTILTESGGRPRVAEVIRVMVGEYMAGAMSNSFLTMITRDMHGDSCRPHAGFFKEMIAPVFGAFSQGLQAARPGLTQEDLNWLIASVIGQVHHFIMRRIKYAQMESEPEAQAFMRHAFPVLTVDTESYVHECTDRITRFSTAAIDGLHPEEA